MIQGKGIEVLRTALRTARERSGTEKVRLVMGNEAADLDSMVSSLLYAWYLAETEPQIPSLPYIPINREDFKLRTEAVYLFQDIVLPVDELLFREDLDCRELQAQDRLELVLVDHNSLGKSFAGLASSVVAIIDHHTDEGLYPEVKERLIKPVGSCVTLVAEKILHDRSETLERDMAVLMLGTILLDTVNLDEKAGRVTERDRVVAGELIHRFSLDPEKLFARLQAEKFNVAGLTSFDLLRKDYKEYRAGGLSYGMSSVTLSLADWIGKDKDLAEEFTGFIQKRSLDLLIVMLAYTDPEFRRELVVYIRDGALRKKVTEYLHSCDLKLSPALAEQSLSGADAYSQGNQQYSRKKLQPLLQDYLSRIVL